MTGRKWNSNSLLPFKADAELRKTIVTLGSEKLKDFVILDKASSMAGEPAPWAELEPTSSWSNNATILTLDSSSRELSEAVESINAWN